MKLYEILAESKKQEPAKPRNFVAKNARATTSGAGAHKDKKKATKQGYQKHKGKEVNEDIQSVDDWKAAVLQAYPQYADKIKFKGRGLQINAEIPGLDRSFGVYDLGSESGEVLHESVNTLLELSYASDKNYRQLMEPYANYDIFVSLKKYNPATGYIAVAEHPRTKKPSYKANGPTAKDAVQALFQILDQEQEKLVKVTGDANLDFNADFVREILEMSTEPVWAKIVAGPKLVLAGREMLEYPDIMKDEGFKPSTLRNIKSTEGSVKLPGIKISARETASANLIANGRYYLKNETQDRDGNRIFDMVFDSVVTAPNEKIRLGAPGVTVGTTRGVSETATAGSTSAGNVAVGAVYKNKPGKTLKNKNGTAKNALDIKANLLTGGSIKR